MTRFYLLANHSMLSSPCYPLNVILSLLSSHFYPAHYPLYVILSMLSYPCYPLTFIMLVTLFNGRKHCMLTSGNRISMNLSPMLMNQMESKTETSSEIQ